MRLNVTYINSKYRKRGNVIFLLARILHLEFHLWMEQHSKIIIYNSIILKMQAGGRFLKMD